MSILEGADSLYITETAYLIGEIEKGVCQSIDNTINLDNLPIKNDENLDKLAYIYSKIEKFPSLINFMDQEVYINYLSNVKAFFYLEDEFDNLLDKSRDFYIKETYTELITLIDTLLLIFSSYKRSLIDINKFLIKLKDDTFDQNKFNKILYTHNKLEKSYQEIFCDVVWHIYKIDPEIKNREIYSYINDKFCPDIKKKTDEFNKEVYKRLWFYEKLYEKASEYVENLRILSGKFTILKDWTMKINAEIVKLHGQRYICSLLFTGSLKTIFKVGFLNVDFSFLNICILLGLSLCNSATEVIYTIIETLTGFFIESNENNFIIKLYGMLHSFLPKKISKISKGITYNWIKQIIKSYMSAVCFIANKYLTNTGNIVLDILENLPVLIKEPTKSFIVFVGGGTYKQVQEIPDKMVEWWSNIGPNSVKTFTDSLNNLILSISKGIFEKFNFVSGYVLKNLNYKIDASDLDFNVYNINSFNYISEALKETINYLKNQTDKIYSSGIKAASDSCSIIVGYSKDLLSNIWKNTTDTISSCVSNFDFVKEIMIVVYNLLNSVYTLILSFMGYIPNFITSAGKGYTDLNILIKVRSTQKNVISWIGKPISGIFIKFLRTSPLDIDDSDSKENNIKNRLKIIKNNFESIDVIENNMNKNLESNLKRKRNKNS